MENAELLQLIRQSMSQLMDEKLEPIHRKLDEHTRILDEHTRILDEHTRILDEHTQRLNSLSNRVDELTVRLESVSERVEVLEQRLQHTDEHVTQLVGKLFPRLSEEILSLDDRISGMNRRAEFQRNKIASIEESLHLLQAKRTSSEPAS